MSRPGYVDRRGNNKARAARRAWILSTFDEYLGDGRARCRLYLSGRCVGIVDTDTLSVDRLEYGGTYSRDNIQPACKPCQDRQGGLLAVKSNAWILDSYRDARHAWERLFEEQTGFSYRPRIIRDQRGRERRGGRREVTDFIAEHPAPTLRDWLLAHAREAAAS
jgi:hypothetical protein